MEVADGSNDLFTQETRLFAVQPGCDWRCDARKSSDRTARRTLLSGLHRVSIEIH